MKLPKRGLVKFPHIPAFRMENFYNPLRYRVPSPKKPVKGKILIFRGPSGSGKTTMSELLTQEYRGTSKKIKTFHLGFERRKRHLTVSVKDKIKLITLLQPNITRALSKFNFVIIDELFETREEIGVVRTTHPHARILVINLSVPMEISIQRASTRHKGKFYTPLNEMQIAGLWIISHFIKCGEVIDASDNIDIVFERVIRLLKKEKYL